MTSTVEFEIAPGPVLFARYAYPPNSLGYCGPADPAALLGAATSSGGQATLQQLASRFEGAWPYLQLIAACNKIDDPLDRRVVEAYWVGNALLDHVPSMTLVSSLSDRFEERAGKHFSPIAGAVVRLSDAASTRPLRTASGIAPNGSSMKRALLGSAPLISI